jgi:membrane protein YdbS with pleckstrin-like domain
MSDTPDPAVSITEDIANTAPPTVPTTVALEPFAAGPTSISLQNSEQARQQLVPLAVNDGQSPASIPMNCLMQLDPNFPVVDRIGWWILTGVLGTILLVVWLVVAFAIRGKLDVAQWVFLLSIAALVALGLISSRFFPRRTYETTRWQLLENGIEIRKGIWWRHRIFVPHDRIQHTDVNQGPIGRMYGIATLVINTGGTHEPSISLEGINLEVAERLRALLSNSTSKLGASTPDAA